MGTTVTVLMSLALCQIPKQQTPTTSQVVEAVHADMLRIPPGERWRYRYLSMREFDAMQRTYFRPTLFGHCNKLSRQRRLSPPAVVGLGLALRVDLTEYGWPVDLWDRLRDPYWTEQAGEHYENYEWGYTDRGKWVRTRIEKRLVKGGVRFAEWVSKTPEDAQRLADIYQWTGSYAAIASSAWFFNQSAASQDRGVGYHEWLGFTDEKSYTELVGVDEAKSRKRRFEIREAVGESGVATHRVRAIIVDDSFGGKRFKTLDFDNAKDAYAALTILGRDIDASNWKASEQFGLLPNNLWAVGAFDRNGKLARFVPGEIANDHNSKSNDKRIHLGVSCFRCHQNGSLQPIDAWARSALLPPLKLNTADEKKYVELRDQYLTDLEGAVESADAVYERAIKEITGLTAKEDAKRYAELWELYEDARVTTERAAADFDLEPAEFRKRLLDYIKTADYEPTSQFGLAAAVFAHEGKRARSLPIHQYEEVIGQLWRAVKPR